MSIDREHIPLHVRMASTVRGIAFLLFSAVFLPIIIVVALLPPRTNHWYALAAIWARVTLFLFGIRVVAHGLDKLVPGQHYVIVANHRSHSDPFALVKTFRGRELRWVAKQELRRVPLFGAALAATGQILVDRQNRDRAIAAIDEQVGLRDASVVFFAEGRRAPGLELLPFKKGAAAFAIASGLPVLPVAVCGSRPIQPPDALLVCPGVIEVAIGDPLPPGRDEPGARERLTEQARAAVARLLSEHEEHVQAVSMIIEVAAST